MNDIIRWVYLNDETYALIIFCIIMLRFLLDIFDFAISKKRRMDELDEAREFWVIGYKGRAAYFFMKYLLMNKLKEEYYSKGVWISTLTLFIIQWSMVIFGVYVAVKTHP